MNLNITSVFLLVMTGLILPIQANASVLHVGARTAQLGAPRDRPRWTWRSRADSPAEGQIA